MGNVNAELYDFLKENETGLYTQNFEKNRTVFAYVHIYFFRLDDFKAIVGNSPFEEGGLEARMFKDTICVELNDIIDSDGHNLSSYKGCFNDSDWKDYEDRIKEMESTGG